MMHHQPNVTKELVVWRATADTPEQQGTSMVVSGLHFL